MNRPFTTIFTTAIFLENFKSLRGQRFLLKATYFGVVGVGGSNPLVPIFKNTVIFRLRNQATFDTARRWLYYQGVKMTI